MNTYLYIKRHRVTGLLYFGKTTSKSPEKYQGSGLYWKSHLAVHGNLVDTLWYCLYLDPPSISEFAIAFSEANDIVDSELWANLKIENGLDGAPHSEESKEKMRKKTISPQHRAAVSKASKARTRGAEENEARSLALTGIKRTSEFKEKLSEYHSGKQKSELTRAKMKVSATGRKHSEETKAKMSATRLAKAQATLDNLPL